MALTKVYSIEIQMDAAQQQLADANKALRELDKELEGLDRNSPAAKKLITDMAKLAKEVDGLAKETEGLNNQLDSLKPGTMGALVREAQALEAEMQNLTIGTEEWKQKMLDLGRTKGSIKEIEDAVDALDPKKQATAFLDFANGMVGGFGIATVAAENFGLASEGSAAEVEKKMLQLITVMQSVEAVQRALNSETQASLKNVLNLGKAHVKSAYDAAKGWLTAGNSSRVFGITTRTALVSTGIGAFIVLIGLLIANWDTASRKVGEFRQAFASNFPAIGKFVQGVLDGLRDIASFLTFGFVDSAAEAAQAKLEATADKATAANIARRKNLIAEEAAAGRATYALKQAQLADELKLLEKGTQEYADKYSEIRQLKLAHDKSLTDRDKAAAKEAAARRKEALEAQKKASEDALKSAEEAHAKRQQLSAEALTAELASIEEAGKRRYEQAKADGVSGSILLRIEIETLQLRLINYKRHSSEWLAIQSQIAEKEKAIVSENRAANKKAKEEKERLRDQELAELQEASDIAIINLKLRKATEKQVTEATIAGLQEQIAFMEKAGMTRTRAFAELKLQVKELQETLVPKDNSLMGKLLSKLFNVKPEDLAKVKQSLADSLGSMQQSLGYIADSLFSDTFMRLDAYTAYLDEQLALAQERQQAAEQGLQDSMRRREQLEGQLDNARGAKREYLIQQIAKERAEEARLTAEKKKAAAEEAKAAKEKEETEKKRQQLEAKAQALSAATTLATNVQNAALAVQAGLAAVRAGASIPFPANIVAIAAGVAAVAAAVLSAKNLAKSLQATKMSRGGALSGPSHHAGGIPGSGHFANIEVEGGEYVTNKHAYANNREAIERINAIGNSVRFVAIPEHQVRRKFSEGGQLPGGKAAAAVQGDSTPVSNADLAAIRALLQSIEGNTAEAAKNKPGYIGPWESRKIVDAAKSLDKDEQAGKLF